MTTRRSIVLLGSTGFLGGPLARAVEKSWEGPVITVSRGDDPQRARHISLDLAAADVSELLSLIQSSNAAAVVNCIGATGGSRGKLVNLNILVAAKLIDALSNCDDVRFFHIGSAAEYGHGLPSVLTSEEAALVPSTTYGITKLAASMLICEAVRAGHLNATLLRVFNPVGPGLPASSLLGNAAYQMQRALRDGRDSIRLGRLDGHRDFVDSRDVASALVALLHNPATSGEVFNVGRGKAIRLKAVIEHLSAIAGYEGKLEEDGAESSTSGPGSWQVADITKLTAATGWIPERSLEDALQSLWDGASD